MHWAWKGFDQYDVNFYGIDPVGDQKEVNESQIKISSEIGHYANTANKVLKTSKLTREHARTNQWQDVLKRY